MVRRKRLPRYLLAFSGIYMTYSFLSIFLSPCSYFSLTLDERYLDINYQLPRKPSHISSKLQQAAKQYSNLLSDQPRWKEQKQVSSNSQSKQYNYPFMTLTFEETLQKTANEKQEVLLALIDGGFMAMALNFYITCLAAHGLNNYLLVATNHSLCQTLVPAGIHCYVYREDGGANEASTYHSRTFLRKMNIRTDMILDALKLGYRVLHSDTDMTYYVNPFDHINCDPQICELAALQDTDVLNAGFIYINPSLSSISVYARMKKMMENESYTDVDDQAQLNEAVEKQMLSDQHFIPVRLNSEMFQCGFAYYEESARYFGNDPLPCPQCVVVHNNWIVSMEAKVYRAKELHQWMLDTNGYYSNPHTKYLTYSNPLIARHSFNAELHALKNALAIGQALGRIVILPKFHCDCSQCPLNSWFRLVDFDHMFKNKYREHSFLSHPLVPDSIRESVYGPVFINTDFIMDKAPQLGSEFMAHMLDITSSQKLTDADVILLFGGVRESVLHFFHLYDVFDRFENVEDDRIFLEEVDVGMVKSEYRQYDGNN